MPYIKIAKLSDFHTPSFPTDLSYFKHSNRIITSFSGKALLRLDNAPWAWIPVADGLQRLYIHSEIWNEMKFPPLQPDQALLWRLHIRTDDDPELDWGRKQLSVTVPICPFEYERGPAEIPFIVGELLLRKIFEFDDFRVRGVGRKKREIEIECEWLVEA